MTASHDALRRGGAGGGPTLLLLHGLGATGAVWDGVAALAEKHWDGPWVAPDLSGHGQAPRAAPYSFGRFAAEVAPLVAGRQVVVAGHSMGGVVALALASGWFGVSVTACLGLGIKVSWTEEEIAGAAALAARQPRAFATKADAIARYLRVAGLEGLIDPGSAAAVQGVTERDDGWFLLQDPATFAVGAPDMPGLLAAARAPVLLAAGARDTMCTASDLRALQPEAVILDGRGHNAHVEDPDALWMLIERLAGATGSAA